MYKVIVFSRDGDHYTKEFDKFDAALEELNKAEEYYKAGGFERQVLDYPIDIKPPLITERELVKHVYGNLWCSVPLKIEDMDYKQHKENTETPW